MSAPTIVRKNPLALEWLRAAAFAVVTYLALGTLDFYPAFAAPVLALVAGVLGLFAPGVGVLVFVLAVGIPLAAGNILVGALFMLLGFATIQYMGDSQGRNFLVVALAFAATKVGAEWAVVALVGLLLGGGEGALIVLIACLLIELAGSAFGLPAIGTVASGVAPGHPLVKLAALARIPEPLGFGWVGPSLAAANPGPFVKAFTSLRHPILFVAQPLFWALGAAVAGVFRRPVSDPKRRWMSLAGAAAGVAVLAVTGLVGRLALGGPVGIGRLLAAALVSLAAALIAAAASEFVFTPSVAGGEARTSAEDADVDELLRMISSAEEELASKHTVRRTVLITDMKSFSRITEELGSTETARLVQRHRDLLLPIIEEEGGHGKSTGGDGLLAAFEAPGSALNAAVRMQQALAAYNAKRPGEEEILVRAGIATGEVVLDKGGKPFLGDALNRAARVMSLADGGQVFTTQQDVEAAAGVALRTVSHGEFRLKNIAQPVPIVEVLWGDGQEGRAPSASPASA